MVAGAPLSVVLEVSAHISDERGGAYLVVWVHSVRVVDVVAHV